MTRWSLAAVLLVTACGGGDGGITPPPPPPPPVFATPFAALLDSIRRAHDLPALGAAVVSSGGVVRLGTVGVRRHGDTVRVTDADKWHLGSVLKHQTAVLAARLVAQGHLAWETTLLEYFPELTAAMRPEYRGVTLRELLAHTAGFPRDRSTGLESAREARAEVLRWAVEQPPVAVAGTYMYGNVHYMIAGAIMERVMDRAFEVLLAERVWAPLGMTSAGFGAAGTLGLVDQPLGHERRSPGSLVIHPAGDPRSDNPVEYGPAGRAHMSLGDWGRFTSALLSAERGVDTPVLRSVEWKALTAAPVVTIPGGGYGFGLVIADRSWGGGRSLFHDGSNVRHYALVGIAPGRDFAILIAANQWSPTMGAVFDGIFGRLADFHLSGG